MAIVSGRAAVALVELSGGVHRPAGFRTLAKSGDLRRASAAGEPTVGAAVCRAPATWHCVTSPVTAGAPACPEPASMSKRAGPEYAIDAGRRQVEDDAVMASSEMPCMQIDVSQVLARLSGFDRPA